jgi:hypothetical protein
MMLETFSCTYWTFWKSNLSTLSFLAYDFIISKNPLSNDYSGASTTLIWLLQFCHKFVSIFSVLFSQQDLAMFHILICCIFIVIDFYLKFFSLKISLWLMHYWKVCFFVCSGIFLFSFSYLLQVRFYYGQRTYFMQFPFFEMFWELFMTQYILSWLLFHGFF